MSILIVDDTPDNIILLKGILEFEGYKNVKEATCAKEAFAALAASELEDGVNGTDIILMDIMMPEVSGIEACKQIKTLDNCRDIPVIMITAKTELETFKEAFDAGAMDYITKPVNKIELLARLQSALALKKATDARKQHAAELVKRNHELEKAMQEIKTLRGFIPICAYCKKIRDVKGFWQQMESYISQHTEAVFSHGICKECSARELGKAF